MPEKDTDLGRAVGLVERAAMQENLRLRLMLSALPDPTPDSNWAAAYIQWWFRNRKRLRELGATTPDNVA